MAHPEANALETPLGKVPVDEEVLAAVAGLPNVRGSAEAHRREHCREVQLPFLQRAFGDDLRVAALVVGRAEPEDVADVIDTAVALGAFPIISSDLSHYLPYNEAREMDANTAQQIEALEAPLPHESACGARAIDGMLLVAQRSGLVAERLDLRNSGDTAGSRDQVVGYGAFAFRRREGAEGIKEE
jgi:AmmeMemoRadiSam system protein B